MNHATIANLPEIMLIFKLYKETFPYLRKDYVERKILSGNVIFQDGVVIIYGSYKRKQQIGTCQANAGDTYIAEIASDRQDKYAAYRVLSCFLSETISQVWLTVRLLNYRALSFYERIGMNLVGHIWWKQGTISGCVYRYSK